MPLAGLVSLVAAQANSTSSSTGLFRSCPGPSRPWRRLHMDELAGGDASGGLADDDGDDDFKWLFDPRWVLT